MGNTAKWASRTAWVIDPINGSDENVGSAPSPIKTRSEFARRMDGITLTAAVSVSVTSSLLAGDDRMPSIQSDRQNGFVTTWTGTPTSRYTGTVTDYVARNPLSATGYTRMQAGWTVASLIGKLVEYTDGAGHYRRAVIVADLGGGYAWLSPPQDENFTHDVVFTIGQTINVYDFPDMRTPIINGFNTFNYLSATKWQHSSGVTTLQNCSGPSLSWSGLIGFTGHYAPPSAAESSTTNHTFLGAVACNLNGGYNGFVCGRGSTVRVGRHSTVSRIQVESANWSTGDSSVLARCDLEVYQSLAAPAWVFNPTTPGGSASFGGYVYGTSVSEPLVLFRERDFTVGFTHVPTVSGAVTIQSDSASTSANVSTLSAGHFQDTYNNRVYGPAGP